VVNTAAEMYEEEFEMVVAMQFEWPLGGQEVSDKDSIMLDPPLHYSVQVIDSKVQLMRLSANVGLQHEK
jgi:hypothetical protein